MAIKTVDIGNVNWAEVMKQMPVATETANGLMSSSFMGTGPKSFIAVPKHLYKIGDVTTEWNISSVFLYLSTNSNSTIIYGAMTTKGGGVLEEHFQYQMILGPLPILNIYRKGTIYYLYNHTDATYPKGFVYSDKRITDMGKYETLDSTYEEVAITEIV